MRSGMGEVAWAGGGGGGKAGLSASFSAPLLVYSRLGFFLSLLPNLFPGSFPFPRLPRPAPSAPQSLELLGRGGDGGGGAGALPAAVTRGSKPEARSACLHC